LAGVIADIKIRGQPIISTVVAQQIITRAQDFHRWFMQLDVRTQSRPVAYLFGKTLQRFPIDMLLSEIFPAVYKQTTQHYCHERYRKTERRFHDSASFTE